MSTHTQAETQDLPNTAANAESKIAQSEDLFFGRQQQRRAKAHQQSRTWLIEAVQMADKGEAFDQLFLATFPSRH